MFSSRRRPPGRRRAPGRVRYFPDLPVSPVRTGIKAVAGASVVGGFAAAAALPSATAAPRTGVVDASLPLAAPTASTFLDGRTSAGQVSRSAGRTGVTVSAPESTVPIRTSTFGISGFTAVPKPAADAAIAEAAASGYSISAFASQGAAKGLGLHASWVYSAVRSAFGITNIGGYRSGPGAMDHGTGHACDVMITSRAEGDAVAAFVQAHASEFHVKYVIWRQRIWFPGHAFGDWRMMADRGSITANHYDHVHVSVY